GEQRRGARRRCRHALGLHHEDLWRRREPARRRDEAEDDAATGREGLVPACAFDRVVGGGVPRGPRVPDGANAPVKIGFYTPALEHRGAGIDDAQLGLEAVSPILHDAKADRRRSRSPRRRQRQRYSDQERRGPEPPPAVAHRSPPRAALERRGAGGRRSAPAPRPATEIAPKIAAPAP